MLTKLRGAVDTIEGRGALQRDPDRLESEAINSCIKFNKSKYQILHLESGNAGYVYRLGNETLESSLAERCQRVFVDSKLNII